MSKDSSNKRYSFRLKVEDQDIDDFIRKSKSSDSETIRKMLRFALDQMIRNKKEMELNHKYNELLSIIEDMKTKQEQGFQTLEEKLNSKTIQIDSNDTDRTDGKEDETDESFEKSIDSMLQSFGMDDF